MPAPELLTSGVTEKEPKGVPEGRTEGETPLEALPGALAQAVAVAEEEGAALPEPTSEALIVGDSPVVRVTRGEVLAPGETDALAVSSGVLDTAGDLLDEPERDAVEEPDAEAFVVAESAAVREVRGEAEEETEAALVAEGRGEPEAEVERSAVVVPLMAAEAVTRDEVEAVREDDTVPVAGAVEDASSEPLCAGLPLGVPLAHEAPLRVGESEPDADVQAETAADPETVELELAYMVCESVGYEGKAVADPDAEKDTVEHALGVWDMSGEKEEEGLGGSESEAAGDREALAEARSEAESAAEAVAEGEDVVDAEAANEACAERETRGDKEVPGERLGVADTEGELESAAEREEESDGRADTVPFTVSEGTEVPREDALDAALTDGEPVLRGEALDATVTEGEPVPLELAQGLAVAELDGDGGREGGADVDAAFDTVAGLLPLAAGVPLRDREGASEAVPFTTDTLALVVEEPESDAESERGAEGDTLPVAEPLPPARDGVGNADALPLVVTRVEGEAPEGVGAALPLRETEGDAVPLIDRESAPLKDTLAEGD